MIRTIMAMIMCVAFSFNAYAVELLMITDLGSSAGMISLGNIEGYSRNADLVFQNPAALHRIENFGLSFFSTTLFEEVAYVNAAGAYKTKIGTFGFGYMNASVEGIPNTVENSIFQFQTVSLFNYFSSVWKFAYAFSFKPVLHFGASMTYAENSADPFFNGNGVNFDLGVFYNLVKYNADFSLVARNILSGSKVKYSNGARETFPTEIVGGSHVHFPQFSVLGQFRKMDRFNRLLWAVGLDVHPEFLKYVRFRIGHKEHAVLQSIQSNTTLGLGLIFGGVSFDYAYEKSDHFEFDGKHYFSIGVNL